MNYTDLANLLFPDVTETIDDLRKKYPARPAGQIVTRIAPSPTGFFHIGNLFTGVVNERFAHQSGGIFFVRIEDTDQARKVDGAIESLITNLDYLGIAIDEWPLPDGTEKGLYWPYTQSERMHLYRVFAKHMVAQWMAYPCWMSSEQMESIREEQMKTKKVPGIYGNYALWRNKTVEEYIAQYQQDPSCTLRYRAHGDVRARVVFEDINRGTVSMSDNYNDMVMLKWWLGLPTYHLAHIVDDYLMGTTHVTRGEEWLTSVPLHFQLFKAFDIMPPHYCHLPLILKNDNGKKRKVSKRHDPEFNIRYMYEQGYSPTGLVRFVLSLIDSGYEERQKNHPDQDDSVYQIDLDRMGSSGMLRDLDKLSHMNNGYLSALSNQELYDQTYRRAQSYKTDLANLMQSDPAYTLAAISIERHTELDPKRFNTFADVDTQLRFFYDSEYTTMWSDRDPLPDCIDTVKIQDFVKIYEEKLDLTISKEERFAQLKEIAKDYGFAPSNADFKAGGYTAKIGDLAMWMRIQLTTKSQTPDLYSMMQVMGKERVMERLRKC